MKTWQGLWMAALVMASSAWVAGDAQAMCGCMVARVPPPANPTESGALLNKATMVVLMREGTHTVLSFANDYFGPAEDFALVVPVPVVLHEGDVRTLDRGVFDRLQAVAAPHMVELWEQNPCPMPVAAMRPGSSGGGRGMDMLGGGQAEGAAAMAAPPPVVVEAQFQEGEYDITVLGATDSTALFDWLQNNGYHLPRGAERFLRPYVQQGMKFFVARVDIGRLRQVAARRRAQLQRSQQWMPDDLSQLVQGPPVANAPATDADLGRFLSPLRMHYESESFALPVRLGLINSMGEQDLVIHVLSPEGRYEVANYGNRFVPTNVHVHGRAARSFGRFYDTFFGTLSGRSPRRVFTEFAGPITPVASDPGCVGCARPGLAPTDLSALGEEILGGGNQAPRVGAYTLTRLHYRYGRNGLPDDLVFRQARPMAGGMESATTARLGNRAGRSNANDFRVRFIAQHRWSGALACSNPVRGRFGGRQPNGAYGNLADLEWPAARSIPLGAWVNDAIPDIGVRRSRR